MGSSGLIVLGLAGGYATGKTSTANALAPKARVVQGSGSDGPSVFWDHFYFAMPLYRMASAARDMQGDQSKDRLKYEIHQTIIEAFNGSPLYGAPSYDELMALVEKIASIPVPEDGKPRQFLQQVGTDIGRSYDRDIWVKWMRREILNKYLLFDSEYKEQEVCCEHACKNEDLDKVPPFYGAIVSDCRFENEVNLIKSFDNHVMVKFVGKDDKVKELEAKRGKPTMTPEQAMHESELGLQDVDDSVYDAIIDMTEMSLEEQVAATRQAVRDKLGV